MASGTRALSQELGCSSQCSKVRFWTSPLVLPNIFYFFSDLLRLNPNSPDALTLRGLVLFLGGKLPQALQHTQSALRLDPGYEPAQKLRKRVKDVERLKEEGNTAFKASRLNEAVDKYTEALDVSMGYRMFDHLSENALYSEGRRSHGGRRRRTDARDVTI